MKVYVGDEEEGGVSCKDIVPFCVVGSTSQHEVAGKMLFGRATRWGVVECENKAHCEFTQLRDLLIRWVPFSLRKLLAACPPGGAHVNDVSWDEF